MQRVLGVALVAIGVLVNNYAFLGETAMSNPTGALVVLGSGRVAIAAGGVILIATGLLVLLRWARSMSHQARHG